MASCARRICQLNGNVSNIFDMLLQRIIPKSFENCLKADTSIMCASYRSFSTPPRSKESTTLPSSSEAVRRTISRIQELGIRADEFWKSEVSKLPLSIMEQRLQFCAEGGLKTNYLCVTQFEGIVGSSLSVLRSAKFLPEKVDVVHRMLSSIKFVGPYPSNIDLKLSYEEIHFKVLCHCMEHNHGYSFPSWQRYYYAPLTYANRNMHIVKQAGLSWRWIRDHPTIICFANPHNLFKLCEMEKRNELPLEIGQLFRRDADIALMPYEDIQAIFFILMKYRICSHDLFKVKKMEHFLIDPDILDRHLRELLQTNPSKDSNLLLLLYKKKYLVLSPKKASGHLEKLIERQCTPFTNLQNTSEKSWQSEFQQWLESKSVCLEFRPCRHKPFKVSAEEEGADEKWPSRGTRSTKLSEVLAKVLNVPQEFVKTELSRIPLGLTVDSDCGLKTYKFLLDSGYSSDDIKGSLQLLLYPRDLVKEALHEAVYSDPIYKSDVSKYRQLHVCLYHILVKSNYSLYL